MPTIRDQSVKSLLVIGRVNRNELSVATAFVANHEGEHYLVTNWHVVTGRHPDTGQPMSTGAVLDDLSVLHNVAGQLGAWRPEN